MCKPPLKVLTQRTPLLSSYMHEIEFFNKLQESLGSFRYTLYSYPSNRFSPSDVPNQINPYASCNMEVIVELYRLVEERGLENLIFSKPMKTHIRDHYV